MKKSGKVEEVAQQFSLPLEKLANDFAEMCLTPSWSAVQAFSLAVFTQVKRDQLRIKGIDYLQEVRVTKGVSTRNTYSSKVQS